MNEDKKTITGESLLKEMNCSFSMHEGLSIIHRHGRIMHDRAVRHFDLTGQQMGYLKYINEHPGVSQEELARYMMIDKGAVAKSIKDMAQKGYVSREQNPNDRRAYCLFPTEKACEVARCGTEHGARFESQMTEGMTEEEIKQFKELLAKITKNMAKMLEGGNDI